MLPWTPPGITTQAVFGLIQAKTTPSPACVDAKDPPVPVVVTDVPSRMLCPAAWVIVQEVAPHRLIPTTSPMAETDGREKDKAPPEVHKNPVPRTSGFDELALSQISILLKFGI